jgi:hypothetical protein
VNDLREHAIWLLVHGEEPTDYWREEAAKQGLAPIAVGPDTATQLLGVSRDWLEKYVLPHIESVKDSERRLIPVAELERWVGEHSHGG